MRLGTFFAGEKQKKGKENAKKDTAEAPAAGTSGVTVGKVQPAKAAKTVSGLPRRSGRTHAPLKKG